MERCPTCGRSLVDGPVAACCEDHHLLGTARPDSVSAPTEADYCASGGHAYAGDDSGAGRCYCGTRTYPLGGP